LEDGVLSTQSQVAGFCREMPPVPPGRGLPSRVPVLS
jgi:hypothetical protein